MKVSKTLREYIEEQVNIKAEQSAHLADLQKKADVAKEKLRSEKNVLEAKFNAELRNAMKKYGLRTGVGREPYVSISCCYEHDLAEVIAYTTAKNELCEKKRLAVLNIIAEMELGGTKAELMEKLNNLTF